jgi:hypothetical protein
MLIKVKIPPRPKSRVGVQEKAGREDTRFSKGEENIKVTP